MACALAKVTSSITVAIVTTPLSASVMTFSRLGKQRSCRLHSL